MFNIMSTTQIIPSPDSKMLIKRTLSFMHFTLHPQKKEVKFTESKEDHMTAEMQMIEYMSPHFECIKKLNYESILSEMQCMQMTLL